MSRPDDKLSFLSPPNARLEHFALLGNQWFWEKDADLRYTLLTDSFTTIFELGRSEVIGKTDSELRMFDVESKSWRHLQEVLDRRNPFRNSVHAVVRPNGQAIIVSLSGDPVLDAAEQFAGYRGTGKVVARSHVTELDGIGPDSIQRMAAQGGRVGFWEWDEVTDTCIYASEELARMYGMTVPEFLEFSRNTIGEYPDLHPEDRERYARCNERMAQSGQGFEIDFRVLRRDGRIAEVSEVVEPVFDDDGKLVRSIGFVRDNTEANQARTLLRKVSGMYARTEVLARIGHWEWDEVLDRISYCSEELATLHGVTVNEYLERASSLDADLGWVHPDDRERYKQAMLEYVADPAQFEIEYRILPDGGGMRYVRELISPVYNEYYEFVRSIGYVQDISDSQAATERLAQHRDQLESEVRRRTVQLERANAGLRESEKRLRNAARIAKLGHFTWDVAAGKATFCDEEYARIVGVPVSECMQDTTDSYLERMHPDDRNRVADIYWQAYRDGLSIDYEYRLVRPDGEVRHIHEVAHPSFDDSGNVIDSFGAMQDITERVRIREELAEQEQRLYELGANSREVFWILSSDWKTVHYISPAYEQLFGKSCQSLLDDPTSWKDNLHPDDRERIMQEIRDKRDDADRKPQFSEYRVIWADGTMRWVLARTYPVCNEKGEIVRFAGFAEDITERKAAADSLRQAQKMEAIGKLTGGVAHDFNNLLAVILGNASLLKGHLEPDQEELLGEILYAGKRGAELTKQLLAYARKQPLSPARTDANALIVGMVDILSRTLGSTVTVNTELDYGARPVLVDPGLLEDAILNLAVNASDAMPDGGSLTIRTRHLPARRDRGESGDGRLAIEVEDTGTGMSRHVAERAIEPFFTTKGIGSGSGLGLSMVYGFVKQSNGDLQIDSEPGKGTTITMLLAIAE